MSKVMVHTEKAAIPSLNNDVMGTLTIFTILAWQDIDGRHRMKKVTLETHHNTRYVDATHYISDMKEHNGENTLQYIFTATILF